MKINDQVDECLVRWKNRLRMSFNFFDNILGLFFNFCYSTKITPQQLHTLQFCYVLLNMIFPFMYNSEC